MRWLILLSWLALVPTAHSQLPPTLSYPPPNPNSSGQQHLNLNIAPTNPPPIITQVSNSNGSIKPGDRVRVIRGSIIRSGPGDLAYSCGTLDAGAIVTILDYPSPGSEYTPIAAPDNCYSLIPLSAVHHSWAVWVDVKKLMEKPQKILAPTVTLIYGEAHNGEYLASGYTLPKGSLVTIRDEKKLKVQGKEKVYCVILAGGKEKRFVRTADLEGVADAAQQERANRAVPPTNNSPQYGIPNNSVPWLAEGTVHQAVQETDHLPTQLATQVQAADQVYHTAMRYGAWEDARQRYLMLLQADVLSVRILAKNRLEFIGEMQRNPPVVATSHSPQQGTSAYPPTFNREPWMPGSQARVRSTAASTYTPPAVLPTKDMVIRSTPTAASPPASQITIPVPPGASAPQAGVSNPLQQQGQANSARPVTSSPTTQRMSVKGRLNRAMQYDSLNQLYYLTNSQGIATYFVRGVTTSGVRLGEYLGRNVEVEGMPVQAFIDGQQKPQINVDRIRQLQ